MSCKIPIIILGILLCGQPGWAAETARSDLSETPVSMPMDWLLHLAETEYGPCGRITIPGAFIPLEGEEDTTGIMRWDWGDGTVKQPVWFPATHHYDQNGQFAITAQVITNAGVETETVRVVNVGTSGQHGCVYPDRVQIEPPLLLLSPSGVESDQVSIKAWDRHGHPISQNEIESAIQIGLAQPQFWFWIDSPVANIDPLTGIVQATGNPQAPSDHPFGSGGLNQILSSNFFFVRISEEDFGLDYRTLPGDHVSYYLPEFIQGFDLVEITERFEIVEATDLSYLLQAHASGMRPFNGHTQYLVLNPASDGTAPCGVSGNPLHLGWPLPPAPGGNCFYFEPSDSPHWFIIFHELGHNFTTPAFVQFALAQPNVAYSEGLASLGAQWTLWALDSCTHNLGSSARDSLAYTDEQLRDRFGRALADYQAAGADYSEFNADHVDGILYELFDDFGPSVWFDLYSNWLPAGLALDCEISTESDVATFFAAAFSSSTGEDLRDRFRNDYGFPIDDSRWTEFLQCTGNRIAQRTFSVADVCDALPRAAPFHKWYELIH